MTLSSQTCVVARDGIRQGARRDYHDWARLRLENKRRGGELPKGLRGVVRRLHRDDLRQAILDRIDEEVERRVFGFEDEEDANLRDAWVQMGILGTKRYQGGPLDDEPGDEVDTATRVALLEALARDRSFVRHLLALGNRLLHEAHLVHLDPLAGDRDELPKVTPPDSGTWSVTSDLGIGDASVLESIADELAVWIAQSTLKTVRSGCMLTFGDVTSATSKALWLLDPTTNILVDEVDTTGCPREPEQYIALVRTQTTGRLKSVTVNEGSQPAACVRSRGPVLPSVGSYAVGVVNMPAPAVQCASKMRLHYVVDDPNGTDLPRDPGRMSEVAWKSALRTTIEGVVRVLRPGGVFVLLMPVAMRDWTSYIETPSLLEGVQSFLTGLGVTLVRRHLVVESAPPSRPFVGRDTCRRILVVGRTAG